MESGPAAVGVAEKVTFAVEHGCTGMDTLSVKIDIPAGVTSVRALPNAFGKVSVQKDAALNVTSVTWSKADGDVLASDDDFYELTLRLKAPNQPFTKIFFPTHQVCKNPTTGETKTVEWTALTESESEDANAPAPAPSLFLLPAHQDGWNKLTVTAAIADLDDAFGDAQIVWKDAAAYSPNATTTDQIKQTAGATPLTSLAAGDVVWVKY